MLVLAAANRHRGNPRPVPHPERACEETRSHPAHVDRDTVKLPCDADPHALRHPSSLAHWNAGSLADRTNRWADLKTHHAVSDPANHDGHAGADRHGPANNRALTHPRTGFPWEAQEMPAAPHHVPPRPVDPVAIHDLLSGGDPRTLRHAKDVVETVLAQPGRLDELVRCVLDSRDEIVRMRAGDALEKVCRAEPSLLQPHVSLLLGDLAAVRQPSVQWHVAQMLGHVRLSAAQRRRAARLMNMNLDESADWIVLNCSLETLAILARADPAIVGDLHRQLRRHEQSSYRSLANRARKLLRLELDAVPAGCEAEDQEHR